MLPLCVVTVLHTCFLSTWLSTRTAYGVLFWELKTVRSLGWRDFNWRMVCTIESSWTDQPTGCVCVRVYIYEFSWWQLCVSEYTLVATQFMHHACVFFNFQWKWRATSLAIDRQQLLNTWSHTFRIKVNFIGQIGGNSNKNSTTIWMEC